MNRTINNMLTLGMFQLTHPEALSELELREILEDSCIDFSNYKHLSRSELIELYKRVAMPLPKRQNGDNQTSDIKRHNEERSSVDESHRNSVSLNSTNNMNRNTNVTKPKSLGNEFRHTPKKIRLYNSNNIRDCNGIDKRVNDEKLDETPSRKRQKITWP